MSGPEYADKMQDLLGLRGVTRAEYHESVGNLGPAIVMRFGERAGERAGGITVPDVNKIGAAIDSTMKQHENRTGVRVDNFNYTASGNNLIIPISEIEKNGGNDFFRKMEPAKTDIQTAINDVPGIAERKEIIARSDAAYEKRKADSKAADLEHFKQNNAKATELFGTPTTLGVNQASIDFSVPDDKLDALTDRLAEIRTKAGISKQQLPVGFEDGRVSINRDQLMKQMGKLGPFKQEIQNAVKEATQYNRTGRDNPKIERVPVPPGFDEGHNAKPRPSIMVDPKGHEVTDYANKYQENAKDRTLQSFQRIPSFDRLSPDQKNEAIGRAQQAYNENEARKGEPGYIRSRGMTGQEGYFLDRASEAVGRESSKTRGTPDEGHNAKERPNNPPLPSVGTNGISGFAAERPDGPGVVRIRNIDGVDVSGPDANAPSGRTPAIAPPPETSPPAELQKPQRHGSISGGEHVADGTAVAPSSGGRGQSQSAGMMV